MIAATNPAVAGRVAAIGTLRIKAETETGELIRLAVSESWNEPPRLGTGVQSEAGQRPEKSEWPGSSSDGPRFGLLCTGLELGNRRKDGRSEQTVEH